MNYTFQELTLKHIIMLHQSAPFFPSGDPQFLFPNFFVCSTPSFKQASQFALYFL